MSASSSQEIRLIKQETAWPQWVYMKLEWGQLYDDKLELLLTINFGKHNIKVLGSEISFGLRRGQLKIIALQALIPYEDRWPRQEFKESILTKRSVNTEDVSTQNKSSGFDAKYDFKETSTSIDFSKKNDKEIQKKTSVQDEFEHTIWQVDIRGSEKECYWTFEANDGYHHLRGSLIKKNLCQLSLENSKFCAIQYKFEVFNRDIIPLRGFGWPWPENLAGSKKVAIIAYLRKAFIMKNGLVAYESQLWYRNQ